MKTQNRSKKAKEEFSSSEESEQDEIEDNREKDPLIKNKKESEEDEEEETEEENKGTPQEEDIEQYEDDEEENESSDEDINSDDFFTNGKVGNNVRDDIEISDDFEPKYWIMSFEFTLESLLKDKKVTIKYDPKKVEYNQYLKSMVSDDEPKNNKQKKKKKLKIAVNGGCVNQVLNYTSLNFGLISNSLPSNLHYKDDFMLFLVTPTGNVMKKTKTKHIDASEVRKTINDHNYKNMKHKMIHILKYFDLKKYEDDGSLYKTKDTFWVKRNSELHKILIDSLHYLEHVHNLPYSLDEYNKHRKHITDQNNGTSDIKIGNQNDLDFYLLSLEEQKKKCRIIDNDLEFTLYPLFDDAFVRKLPECKDYLNGNFSEDKYKLFLKKKVEILIDITIYIKYF